MKVYRTDQELNLEYCSFFRIEDNGTGWASSSSDTASDPLGENSTSSLSSVSILRDSLDLLEVLLREVMIAFGQVVGRFSTSSS